jgi:hypothetical protein
MEDPDDVLADERLAAGDASLLDPPSDEHRTEPVELLERSSMHEARARKRVFSTLSLTVLTISPKSKLASATGQPIGALWATSEKFGTAR